MAANRQESRDVGESEKVITDAVKYAVNIFTGWKLRGAGTNANVFFTLYGADGESPQQNIENRGSTTFENGMTYKYNFDCPYLGTLIKIRIGHDNTGNAPDWYLDKVTVKDPKKGDVVKFPCHNWLERFDGQMVERELVRKDEKPNKQAKLEKKRQAKLEEERPEKLEKERQAKLEKERQAKLEKERQAKLEKGRQAKLEKERRAKLEKERQAKLEKERRVKLEKERQAKLEKERQEKLEEERPAKLEKERPAKLEKERQAKLEKERQAKLEEERQAKLEKERQAKLEKERQEKLEEERQAKLEKERQEKLEEERQAKLEKERQEKLEKERQEKLEKERRAKLEKERQEKLEKERQEKLEKDRQEKVEDSKALGMESVDIKDEQITAPSHTEDTHPTFVRLHHSRSWCAGEKHDSWLQVDLEAAHWVTAVATQGNPRGNKDYVKKLKIQYSEDGKNWATYEENGNQIFDANVDNTTIKSIELQKVILARYIRICPLDWHVWPCMRMELYGFPLTKERKTYIFTYAHNPDLQKLIEFLQTDDINLIVNSAFYLQHLSYNDDAVKTKIRKLGGIPVLVRLLDHEVYAVHQAAVSCLISVSHSERQDNKLAIAECYGIEALIRLLERTPKDESELRFVARRDVVVLHEHSPRTIVHVPIVKSKEKEVKELVLGVLLNLSSCEILKMRIIRSCLTILIKLIIIPYSGWDKEVFQNGKPIPAIKWTAVLRIASGILRHLSSAGADARKEMRACEGLVDSLVWVICDPVAKTDVDNKSTENCVYTLRYLSYRLEDEVDWEHYEDAPAPLISSEMKKPSCFSAFVRTKKSKQVEQPEENSPPPEGVVLLWQPKIVDSYLSIMAKASNPDTIEGVACALINLMACNWKWALIKGSKKHRKYKGLPVPILIELLRVENDHVVRAIATCLRNLAVDPQNTEVLGKFAMEHLARRLPDPKNEDETKYDSSTVGPLLCAIHQVIYNSLRNGKLCRDKDGFRKIVAIAESRDKYPEKIVIIANQVLMTLWNFTALKNSIKKEGWKLNKEVFDEFGPPPAAPCAFDYVTMPRDSQRKKNRIPEPIREDESPLAEPTLRSEPPRTVAEDGYKADDDEEIEMQDLQGRRSSPAYEGDAGREEPIYATVDESKKMKVKGGLNSDSRV